MGQYLINAAEKGACTGNGAIALARLDRLFRPASIAVVGGGAWCANVIRELLKMGYDGQLWAVHPTREVVAGVKAYASVSDLPDAPDASFIGVNRAATVDVVRDLARRGAGGAVCFASGFQEAVAEASDGGALQEALCTAAGDMPILGPNCYGFLNALDGAALWPDHHGLVPVTRGVAILTQSSNIALNLSMQTRGLPIAYLLTAGNQAQTSLSDIALAALEDPRVTVLGLHIEGLGDVSAFEALATQAHALGKPIVVLKAGASDQAQAAAISHTASLTGSDAGSRAFFERLGAGQVESLTEFLETLKLLHVIGPLASNRIGSLSCSGGEASLMADLGFGCDVVYPPLSERQRTALRTALGPMVALANPLDYHTYIWAQTDAMTRCFSAMADPDLALTCVVLDFPRSDRCDATEWPLVVDAMEAATQATGTPMALVSSLPETMPEDVALDAMARGIVPLCGMTDALKAIEVAARIARGPLDAPPVWPTGALLPGAVLSEAEAKSELQGVGVPVPVRHEAHSPEQVGHVAKRLNGPMVVKAVGAAHKSENGAVALNLRNADEAKEAAARMGGSQFLVEEMIIDGSLELLVGVTRDPAHGFVLTLGAGGVLTELWHDTVSILLPATPAMIKAALGQLRIAPLFGGYRGRPAANVDAVLEVILAVQSYVAREQDRLEEVEINPLIVTPARAVAVDALIRLGEQE